MDRLQKIITLRLFYVMTLTVELNVRSSLIIKINCKKLLYCRAGKYLILYDKH